MKADRSRYVRDFGPRCDARKGVISVIIISARKTEGVEYVTDRDIRTPYGTVSCEKGHVREDASCES